MPLDCPRCKEVHLDEIEVGEVLIDRCPRCAGLWFDNAEIGRVLGKDKDGKKIDSTVPPPADANIPGITCPRCDQVQLREMSFARDDGKKHFLYRCISCLGTWVDRGELRECEDPDLDTKLKTYFSGMPC